ncbi:MAG TPA: CapA family protein [Coleofasciculaceae cyanobacterium]|jgi:poly-gamma-glutamate synthesis protein (capsule biosynthesis protein)
MTDKTPNGKTVRLAFLGDVMLGRCVNEEMPHHPPSYFWGDTLPLLQDTDAVFANLECAVTTHTRPWFRTPKVFHFRADPEAVEVLRVANIRCVSLANNHILDFEEEGLLDTLKHLDRAGIVHAGAGRHLAEAQAPVIVEVQGLKIGFLACTDNEPAFAATEAHPGTCYQEINLKSETMIRLGHEVAALREAGAAFIVLSLHWGPNMVQAPPPRFQTFARSAILHGVDLIHGHSAHVFQGIEFCNHGLILYDTGDFLDDYAVDPQLRNDWSFIFMIELKDGAMKHVQALPVRLGYACTNLATGEEAQAIRARMQRLCQPFGTQSDMTENGLEFTRIGRHEPVKCHPGPG